LILAAIKEIAAGLWLIPSVLLSGGMPQKLWRILWFGKKSSSVKSQIQKKTELFLALQKTEALINGTLWNFMKLNFAKRDHMSAEKTAEKTALTVCESSATVADLNSAELKILNQN
jgi:hypothetical protein